MDNIRRNIPNLKRTLSGTPSGVKRTKPAVGTKEGDKPEEGSNIAERTMTQAKKR